MSARLLPNGMYELEYPDGTRYTVPEQQAMESFPESFPSPEEPVQLAPWQDQHLSTAAQEPVLPEPEPELPPWELPAVPAEEEASDEETTFTPEEAGYADGSPLGSAVSSISSSSSVSETGPYKEAEILDPTEQPKFDSVMRKSGEATEDLKGIAGDTAEQLRRNQEEQENILANRALQMESTIRKQNEMHEAARAEVDRKEEELAKSLSEVSRMDMGKIWKDSDATVHFAGYMAAGIAGFLNPTGKNSVIEQMQGLADMSAREQAANIKLEMEQVRGQQSALSRYEDRMEGDEARYLKQRAMLEQSMLDQLTQKKSEFQSIITVGKFDQMIPELEMAHQQTIAQYREKVYQNAFASKVHEDNMQQKSADRAQRAAVARRSQADSLRRENESRRRWDAEHAPQERVAEAKLEGFGLIYTQTGEKLSDPDKRELRTAVDRARNVAAVYDRIGLIVAKGGRAGFTKLNKRERKEWLDAEISELHSFMRDENGANLTKPETELVLGKVGNPQKWLSDPKRTRKILAKQMRSEHSRLAGKMSTMNLQVRRQTGMQGGQPVYGDTAENVQSSMASDFPGYNPTESGKLVHQSIRKSVEGLEVAKKSRAEAQMYIDSLDRRVASRSRQEPAIGRSGEYAQRDDSKLTEQEQALYDDRKRRVEAVDEQLRTKAEEILSDIEENKINFKEDPKLAGDIMSHLNDIGGTLPDGNSYVAAAKELMSPVIVTPAERNRKNRESIEASFKERGW